MTALFIVSLVLIALAAAGAVWILRSVYERAIAVLTADNIDLRNRLFISKGQAPSGVDVTAQYVEKAEERKVASDERKRTGPKSPGVLPRWKQEMVKKDLSKAENGLDLTKPKDSVN